MQFPHRALFFACVVIASTPLFASARSATNQVSHHWVVNVSGRPMHCVALDGQRVLIELNPFMSDVGMASRFGGQPFIRINPRILSQYSSAVSQWWFAHECAHHMLQPDQNSEEAADCYGIRRLVSDGIIYHPRQLDAFATELRHLPGTDLGHLPGTLRAMNITRCAFS